MRKIYAKYTNNRQVWEYNITLWKNNNPEFIFDFALNDVSDNTWGRTNLKFKETAFIHGQILIT